MFCINVILNVKSEGDVATVRDLLTEAGRLSRSEPGCIRFEVCHSQSDPQTFILCERWESEEAWKQHREEKAFTEIYKPQVLPLVDRVPHISTLLE
ncbi:Antibiotic biosynthesis monooxygenase [Maioricimonas rarisocia]|uniref:Antibiotic biosynthesis monooxygenase n=1 Tax=Maioricimonas rarisocia TaxID=2528026 RepID=A0A517Z8S9_9PLAN|nr:antibiotic biosynthesis monooxygenase family protein [Maioricimonas rarisocia]QDU38841.1 Antibiotic biosynthesis monooxygenase [Maioricimonas rarisocia]